MYYVYVLENPKKKWYIGQTDNLEYRLARHNNNKVRSTKNRGPWGIKYMEEFSTRTEAMRKEEFLKSGKGRKFLKTVLEKNN